MALKYIMKKWNRSGFNTDSIYDSEPFDAEQIARFLLRGYNEEDLDSIRSVENNFNAIIPLTSGVEDYFNQLGGKGVPIDLGQGRMFFYKRGTSVPFENRIIWEDNPNTESIRNVLDKINDLKSYKDIFDHPNKNGQITDLQNGFRTYFSKLIDAYEVAKKKAVREKVVKEGELPTFPRNLTVDMLSEDYITQKIDFDALKKVILNYLPNLDRGVDEDDAIRIANAFNEDYQRGLIALERFTSAFHNNFVSGKLSMNMSPTLHNFIVFLIKMISTKGEAIGRTYNVAESPSVINIPEEIPSGALNNLKSDLPNFNDILAAANQELVNHMKDGLLTSKVIISMTMDKRRLRKLRINTTKDFKSGIRLVLRGIFKQAFDRPKGKNNSVIELSLAYPPGNYVFNPDESQWDINLTKVAKIIQLAKEEKKTTPQQQVNQNRSQTTKQQTSSVEQNPFPKTNKFSHKDNSIRFRIKRDNLPEKTLTISEESPDYGDNNPGLAKDENKRQKLYVQLWRAGTDSDGMFSDNNEELYRVYDVTLEALRKERNIEITNMVELQGEIGVEGHIGG